MSTLTHKEYNHLGQPKDRKSRDIILPTKVRLVKAMVFPVVMCGCEKCNYKIMKPGIN